MHDLHLRAAQAAEVLDALPGAVFVCDLSSLVAPPRYLFVSTRVREVLGVDREAILRDPSERFRHVPREDTERILRTIREAAAGDGTWNQEFRVVVDGRERWVEGQARIYLLQDGSAIAHGYWVDITARKRLEAEQRATHERFRLLLDAAPHPIGITDDAGDLVAVNRAYTQTFGYCARDAPKLAELFALHYPDPAYRAEIERNWLASIEAYRRTQQPGPPVICRPRCKDGNELVVEVRSAVASHGETIVVFNDITAQVRAAEAQASAEADRARTAQRLELQAIAIPMALVVTDADADLTIREWNPAAERIFGFTAAEVIGRSPYGLVIPEERRGELEAVRSQYAASRGTVRVLNQNLTRDGRRIWCEWFNTPILDASGDVVRMMSMAEDVTARIESEQRIRYLAQYDALTGLPNRTLLGDRLGQLIAAASREHTQFGVLFIDLDRFKDVNDSLGHAAGDELLVTIAERLCTMLRRSDTVARMGGDEFVVLLPRLRHPEDAAVVARKLMLAISEPLFAGGNELIVSATIGICIHPGDGVDPGQLIRNADAAMYEAKNAGRGTYRFYTRDLNERALSRLSLENGLRRARANDELSLHYQPQIDLSSGRIFGAEALMRWKRPGIGFVSPAEFIPIAEERGLIAGLGRWALDEAASTAAAWKRAGIPVAVAVNLSAVQFREKNFVEQVAETIAKHDIAPAQLELELTESVLVRDADAAIEVLGRLHELGVLLSIDDFGTGYSSLNYLRRFPVDRVKIDRSFIDELTRHAGTVRVVSGIIGLAKGFGLKVVAEGVETQEQLDILRREGCDQAQGYLFSRPLPAPEFEAHYRTVTR